MDHREMRRKDRQIPEGEAWELLGQGEYGVLSTVGEEGQPYGIPLSYTVMDGRLYFHGALKGQKVDNIAHEERVSFCVVGKTQPVYDGSFTTLYESAVAFGRAKLLGDGEEKRKALELLCEKYLPQHMDKAAADIGKMIHATMVCRIDVDHVTGKRREMSR